MRFERFKTAFHLFRSDHQFGEELPSFFEIIPHFPNRFCRFVDGTPGGDSGSNDSFGNLLYFLIGRITGDACSQLFQQLLFVHTSLQVFSRLLANVTRFAWLGNHVILSMEWLFIIVGEALGAVSSSTAAVMA